MIQLLLNKSTPHFQLLPMSKVDLSYLRIPIWVQRLLKHFSRREKQTTIVAIGALRANFVLNEIIKLPAQLAFRGIIGTPAKRHLSSVSLVGGFWPASFTGY